MILYPHQQEIVDKSPHKHGLFFGTGVGKTPTAIALAEKNAPTALIICPKMLKPMWLRETEKHADRCKFFVLTKEEFKKIVKTLRAYDAVIVDEAHYFLGLDVTGRKSQLLKSLLWYFKTHNIEFRWLLSATPRLSSPMSVLALAYLLGHNWSYWNFRKKFFIEIRLGSRTVPKARANMDDELASLIQSLGSVVDLDTAVTLAQANVNEHLPELEAVPDQIFETEYFELTQEQKEAIKELELTEVNFITKFTKTHCIEQGVLYSDGYTEDRTFPSKKTDRILELCKKNPKIAIFCRYNHQISFLSECIQQVVSKENIFVINGDVKDRDGVIRQAESSPSAVILIQSDTAQGYELPSFNLILFASLSFSHINYVQACGRFLRINKMAKNKYIHLVARGVDEDIYKAIMRGEDFYVKLYEGCQILPNTTKSG